MTQGEEGSRWDSRLFAEQLGKLGERVRAERRSRGWSQPDLSSRAEVHPVSISRIEGGKQNITLEVLSRLANTLQLHWADLLDDRLATAPEPTLEQVSFEQRLLTFGTRAYQARVLQRLSQQVLADRTGIGRTAISGIEDGSQNVTLETLSRLAAGLDVHWAELLDDREDRPPRPGR